VLQNKIALLSNTITKPLNRFLKEYELTHYPLDSVIEQLYKGVEESTLIILLDANFFQNEFALLENAIAAFREKSTAKIMINTISETFHQIYTPLNMEQELELLELNQKITSLSEKFLNIAILDFYTLTKKYGYNNLINEKNRYLFQTPFTKLALELLSKEIKETLTLFETTRVKAIAVDADNTLWGGIVGEDGIENIQIDNNYPGVVYRKFQEYLLALQRSGIILILLSKNDEKSVQEVFELKNMPLTLGDFVATAINWNAKSENLEAILHQLKLTKSNLIFLDDSDAEIEEMQSRMGIPSYKMNPKNPLENLETLQHITALKTLKITQEDRKKSLLYQDEKERLELSSSLGSKEDFIASLGICIKVSCNNSKHLQRVSQLINKTNQFNLTTKRYNIEQVQELMQSASVYDFSVEDKFGDMGLVGVVIIKENLIDTFLMSCRVLGRGIEERILAFITQKHPNLSALYIPTPKNTLVEEFYEKSGFKLLKKDTQKHYKFSKSVDINKHIKVEYDN